jgi:tetratricopeptide (TPR) repeat protein
MTYGFKNQSIIKYINTMKTKLTVLFVITLIGFTSLTAQECTKNLSLFNDSAKAGIYQDAMPRYKKLIVDCPTVSVALYQRADKMFEDLLEKAEEANDEAKVKELAHMMVKNIELRMENFPDKTPFGKYNAEIGKIMYENGLGTIDEQFKYFDDSWKQDSDNFMSPKGLYIYFLLFDKEVDEEMKTINELFVKYDEIINQIERMENEQALVAKPLLLKQENEEKLSPKEARSFNNSNIYLKNYAVVKGAINGVLGQKAECENLIPMYNRDFEENKSDEGWLKVAASRMSAKDCTSDPLFFKLVEALHNLAPSPRTAYYLGRLAIANGDTNKALGFFNDAAELEKEPLDKAKVYFEIAEIYKKRGSFSSATKYYNLALDNKPSLGIAYLRIADMIAKSANDCGGDTFEKRATYWKAASFARRAASVDATIRDNASATAESYEQRAPSKADIFQNGMSGKTINLNCWVGGSVKVPSI